MFDFLTSVGDTFGKAWDLFQTGASIYSRLKKDEGEESDSFVPKYDFGSSLRSARPTPQTMEAPIGLKAPNIQAAYRYFAENVASDRNLQSIKDTSYTPRRTSKIASLSPTITMSDANTITRGKTTVKTSGVIKV